jgi:spore germination protein YaaH
MRILFLISLLLLYPIQLCFAAEPRTNMSYLYFGSPTSYIGQMDKTQNTLTMVSPNYLDIVENGAVVVTWKLDTSFISEMHRRGIRVVPFLSNHWNAANGIAALDAASVDTVTTQIVNVINQYDLDGVNVDIEGVGATYRDAFTTFVRLLRAKMPPTKEVSVAVAANPNGWTTGWHGFYNYPALAEVADYLMIMSYDESWQGSDPGPVSSIGFFERSLKYALNQGVGLADVVMGVPFYGRLWKVDGPTLEGMTVKGIGVSNVRVEPILSTYGAATTYDESKQSPYATFTIPAGQSEYISGVKCTEGTYVLWFDNEQSIKKKLRLVNDYGVRGAGSWSLYQETAATWNYYARWLNGAFYRDVASGFWAEDVIMEMADKGWMTGISSTSFVPQGALTRAQSATIFVRALALATATAPSPFVDTQSHWAKDAIATAYQAGLLQGVDATHFKPDEPMTRAQMAAIMSRMASRLSPP